MSSVLWFQAGACSGNTMSFLNAEEPNVVDLIVDFGLEVIWHPSLGVELGDNATKIFNDCASGARPMDIFVLEGSVIQAADGTWGHVRRPPDDRVGHRARQRGVASSWRSATARAGAASRPWSPTPASPRGCSSTSASKGGFLGPDWRSKAGLPVINIPGCPAHPDWITQILVALATGRAGDIALDDLHRPQTFFKTFTQTGCTRVQFFEYKQSTTCFGEGTRTGCLFYEFGCRGPMTHSPVQPDPVEPPVVQDPGRDALHRAAPSRSSRSSTWPPARSSRPRRCPGPSPRKSPRVPTTSPTWRTPQQPASPPRSGPKKTCSWSETTQRGPTR